MTPTRPQIIDLVQRKSGDIDAALICAIIEQESGFNPWAIRYEPAFFNRYIIPLQLTNITEAQARSFSWGLMQIMGQAARELGYSGHMAQLSDPETNLFYGIQHFRNKMTIAGNDSRKALLLWNGGGNALYPEQVLARIGSFTTSNDPRDNRDG